MSLLVSVIVVVYNGERFLPQCLSSLMNLDFSEEDLEIILVDNNSTDKTKEIIQQYPVRYIFESRVGVAIARNRGLKEARGQYIAFIDSDYIADKFWLKHLVSAFRADSIDVGAGGGEIKFSIPQTFWEEYSIFSFLSNGERILGKDLLKRALPHLGTANSIFRRDVFDRVGIFDENFIREEDLDLCLRILLKGYKLKYAPQAIAYRTDYDNFVSFLKKRIISGLNIAKIIYKYKNIFQYNIIKEYIIIFIYDFLDIIDRYRLAVKEGRFRVSFLALNILSSIVQSLGLLLGILIRKGGVISLPKSFVECNKTIATIKININGKYLSYNTGIVPLIFGDNEEIVFLNVNSNSFYHLKGVGTQIWELITQRKTIQEIIEIIALKYDIDKEMVKTDLRDLLTEFIEKNILIEV